MRIIRLLLLSAFSLSLPAHASLTTMPWLEPMLLADDSHWMVSSLKHMEKLYDCGEVEEQEYCSEIVNYYSTQVESTLWLKNSRVTQLELAAPFSNNAYSSLMLNLRRDGFVLARVELGQQVIDVAKALQSMKDFEVNREVVMLMNRRPLSSPRKLLWVPAAEFPTSNPERSIEFISSGSGIKLLFTRH